jgi:hypothetical protein
MFKQLYLGKELFVLYYTPLQDYNFVLRGKKIDGTSVEYLVSYQKNKLFTVGETIANKHRYLDDLHESHELIQAFKDTIGFKQAMSHIRIRETKMKNQLQIVNPFLEGKIDDQTYVLSFQLKIPVLNKERIYLKPGADKTNDYEVPSPKRFFYVALKRQGNTFTPCSDIKFKVLLSHHHGNRPNAYPPSFYEWTSLKTACYTHRLFIEDIVEVLINDRLIRVKLLVN